MLDTSLQAGITKQVCINGMQIDGSGIPGFRWIAKGLRPGPGTMDDWVRRGKGPARPDDYFSFPSRSKPRRYSITSVRSDSLRSPANAILPFGIIALGLVR